ncbi:MAG: stage II sporulation protein M [Bacteroidota bacterium]
MRETQFIKQHERKWAGFEKSLDGQANDANDLRELFVEVTDDLSYSRTFYPNRSVRVYLNRLAQRIYLRLYRSRRSPANQLREFWVRELPLQVYEARTSMALSFFLFFLCMGIGMLSCAMDPEFAQVILGESYVDMTRANIENGDPMAVYKERGRFDMFLGITFNNLYVAFLAFSMGVFFGLGSIVILVSNAIMVGCFQYFFIQEGLFWDSFLTIWIHGALEISAIVIATAAGITMGRGPAFPGTYTRLQAFQQSARRGGKIMLGTTPLFILAGFFEGFLTRLTDIHWVLRLVFISICFSFIFFYFFWYPYYLGKQKNLRSETERDTQRMPHARAFQLTTGRVKTNGEIMGEMFALIRRYWGSFLGVAVAGSLLYCGIVFTLVPGQPAEIFPFMTNSWFTSLYDFLLLFSGGEDREWVAVAGGTLLFGLAWVAMRNVNLALGTPSSPISVVLMGIGVALIMCLIGHVSWWVSTSVLMGLPLALLYTSVLFAERANPFVAIGRTFELLQGNFARPFGLNLLNLLLGLALFTLVNSVFVGLFFQLLNWIIAGDQAFLDAWSWRITTFLLVLIASFIWSMLFTGTYLLYFSLRETKDATGLREQLAQIGQQKRLRGLERE